MIEHGHMAAYRVAALRAQNAFKEKDRSGADIAEKQMAAIRDLEQARVEIFDRHGVSDIDVSNEDLVSPSRVVVKKESIAFITWLRQMMGERGLTQSRVAELAKVDQSNISRILRGVVVNPKSETRTKTERALLT